jgi:hypothetical protein
MYWWDHAAELLTKRGTALKRFGLVTTNSISQVFQRKVMERHLKAKKPVSLVMAIPDHPWRGNGKDNASVRIAMTVAEAGKREGVLRDVKRESGLETDAPEVEFTDKIGSINSDLTQGVDLSQCVGLLANEGLSSRGMSLHGSGFIVSPNEAVQLGLGIRAGLDLHIREYCNGRDLLAHTRGMMVIDLFGLESEQIRKDFPEIYQHLVLRVKSQREYQFEKSGTKDSESYAKYWWVFGKPRQELRASFVEINRYVVTVETAKHRVFQFLDTSVIPDNRIVCMASQDAYVLGVLSSRFHVVWTLANGGTLEDRPIYTKSQCFDPFPFPVTDDLRKQKIRAIAEELDAHRKRVLGLHPHLTLTGLYNVLERLRAGIAPAALEPAERRIFDDGLVLILKELHDRLDVAVADAYGWPADLVDEEILARLVALNRERAKEEARGLVRWLRPEYQIPKFGSAKEKAEQIEATLVAPEAAVAKPAYPTADAEQTAVVMAALMDTPAGLDAAALAARFKKGRGIEAKITAVLAALHRLGLAWSDDGNTWRLRRAA